MNFEKVFDKSYHRVMDEKDDFFSSFYQIFLNASPEIPPLFQNTNMAQQQTVMRQSFYKLFTFYASGNSDSYLEKIAIAHNKSHLNIRPELYDIWLESMIETLKIKDSDFDERVELAWRLVLNPGIVYMKFMYSR